MDFWLGAAKEDHKESEVVREIIERREVSQKVVY